jgi:simple sugar transport system permease protein
MAVAEATTVQGRASFGWRVAGWFVRRREASIFVIAVGLVVYFSARQSSFYQGFTIQTLAVAMAPYMLICAGEVMLLICGEIDLSVGHIYALAPIVMFVISSQDEYGLPIWLGVLLGLLAAAAVGLANGLITTFFRVPSFITTLGMLFILGGINLRLLHGTQVLTPGGHTFQGIMAGSPFAGSGRVTDLSSEFYWALGLVLVVQFILSYTRWGLHTVATGGNLIGAAESGVNVRMVKTGNFVLAATLAGFAGILDSVRVTSTEPLQGGSSYMFFAVAGAVIGGTSLLGGAGTVIGGFLGVAMLTILQIGFIQTGVNIYNFNLVIGIAILASMVINIQIQRLKNVGKLQ